MYAILKKRINQFYQPVKVYTLYTLFFLSLVLNSLYSMSDTINEEYRLMCKSHGKVFGKPNGSHWDDPDVPPLKASQQIVDRFDRNYQSRMRADLIDSQGPHDLRKQTGLQRTLVLSEILATKAQSKNDRERYTSSIKRYGRGSYTEYKDLYPTSYTLEHVTFEMDSRPTERQPLNFLGTAPTYNGISRGIGKLSFEDVAELINDITTVNAGQKIEEGRQSYKVFVDSVTFLLNGEVARRLHAGDVYSHLPIGFGIMMAFDIARKEPPFLSEFFDPNSNVHIFSEKSVRGRETKFKSLLRKYRETCGTLKERFSSVFADEEDKDSQKRRIKHKLTKKLKKLFKGE